MRRSRYIIALVPEKNYCFFKEKIAYGILLKTVRFLCVTIKKLTESVEKISLPIEFDKKTRKKAFVAVGNP